MPLVVINLLGPEENAYFYVAWAIATLLFSIPGALAQSLFAEGSHDKRKVGRDVKRSVLMSMVLLLPAILFVWLLGGKMLLAFGGSYSERSIELLRILALAGIPITVERAYFAVLRIRGRLRELSLWRSLLTVVLIAASYALLPQMGLSSPSVGLVGDTQRDGNPHHTAAFSRLAWRSAIHAGIRVNGTCCFRSSRVGDATESIRNRRPSRRTTPTAKPSATMPTSSNTTPC